MTIKFEIDTSLRFKGGIHYSFVYADDVNEVVEALKDAWYESGIHRHGGELFLKAHMDDSEDNEISLYLGDYSVDEDGELYSEFVFPDNEDERADWYKLGLFVEDDGFESVLEALLDTSSPDRVLGSYLYKVSMMFPKLSDDLKSNLGAYVLADILNFAKLHNKTKQMYDWIIAEEGKKFLTSQGSCFTAGKKVVGFIENQKIDDLEAFIEKNKDRVGLQPNFPI